MTFAHVTDAIEPKTKNAGSVALFFAFIVLVMAVGQLFGFEKFIPLVERYGLAGGHGTAVLVASLLVIAEVFSLPFLLRMKTSPLMRMVSMACGWLVVAAWLFLALWANVAASGLTNIGFFGTAIKLPVGWWAVLFALALGALASWSAWGLWPGKFTQKSLKK